MKILSGAYVADEGEIWVNGKKAHIRNPQDSTDLGIGMIYQDLALFNNFDVAKNIFVGRERTRGPFNVVLDKKRMYREAEELIRELKVDIKSPKQSVRDHVGRPAPDGRLCPRDRLRVEDPHHGRAHGCLGGHRGQQAARSDKNLANKGLSILLITQRIPDILAIADRVFVLKGGVRQAVLNVSEITLDDVVT